MRRLFNVHKQTIEKIRDFKHNSSKNKKFSKKIYVKIEKLARALGPMSDHVKMLAWEMILCRTLTLSVIVYRGAKVRANI